MSDFPVIGHLGTGIIGSAMVRQFGERGADVRVWNRTSSRAEALEGGSVTAVDTASRAAADADALITTVTDGDAIRSIFEKDPELWDALDETVWLQMSTVGIDDTTSFAERSEQRGIDFVDAPVLGTKEPAEAGELTVLAGGAEKVRRVAEPIFDAVGSRTFWLDEPGDATRLKLVCNNWVVGLLGVLAETYNLAEGIDVDPDLFFEAIAGGALDAGYAHVKGDAMAERDYPASFPLEHALKDTNLILEAAERADVDMKVAASVAAWFESALDEHGDEDMAAIIEAMR